MIRALRGNGFFAVSCKPKEAVMEVDLMVLLEPLLQVQAVSIDDPSSKYLVKTEGIKEGVYYEPMELPYGSL